MYIRMPGIFLFGGVMLELLKDELYWWILLFFQLNSFWLTGACKDEMKLIDAVDIMERLQSCLTTPSIPCSCSSSSLSRAGGLMIIEFLPCWAHARHILVRAGTFNTHGSMEVQAVEHREESILSKTMPWFLFSQLVNLPICPVLWAVPVLQTVPAPASSWGCIQCSCGQRGSQFWNFFGGVKF